MQFFSVHFLKKLFGTLLLGAIIMGVTTLASASAQEYKLIMGFNNMLKDGSLELKTVKLVSGAFTTPLHQFGPESYTLNLVSRSKQQIFTMKFLPAGQLSDSVHTLQEVPFSIDAPYLVEAQTIQIKNPSGTVIISKPIPPLDTLANELVETVVNAKEGRRPAVELSDILRSPARTTSVQKPALPLLPLALVGWIGIPIVSFVLYRIIKIYKKKAPSVQGGQQSSDDSQSQTPENK